MVIFINLIQFLSFVLKGILTFRGELDFLLLGGAEPILRGFLGCGVFVEFFVGSCGDIFNGGKGTTGRTGIGWVSSKLSSRLRPFWEGFVCISESGSISGSSGLELLICSKVLSEIEVVTATVGRGAAVELLGDTNTSSFGILTLRRY